MSAEKVLIIGGGIAGLAFANGCKKYGIPFHVYEKDRTEAYRAQGYRIRIGGPAIAALKYLLSEEAYHDFDLSTADIRVADIPEIDAETGNVVEPEVSEQVRADLNKQFESSNGKPMGWCVDRSNFRAVMIKHLDSEDISYDKVLESYEETSDGVVAHFADGTEASGTLIVGAEGRGSKVRSKLVPELQIVDSGMKCLYGKTPITDELLKAVIPAANERLSFIKDRTHEELAICGLEPITFPHRQELEQRGLSSPPDYIFWAMNATPMALGFRTDEKRYLSPEESEQRALEVSEKWAPGLRAVIEHQQKGETSVFGLTVTNTQLPVWESNKRATVMGDCIHPMAPTGSGAVMALNDARLLCEALTGQGFTQSAIRSYEQQMREAANKAIPVSWGMLQQLTSMTKSNEKHMGQMAMTIRAKNVQR